MVHLFVKDSEIEQTTKFNARKLNTNPVTLAYMRTQKHVLRPSVHNMHILRKRPVVTKILASKVTCCTEMILKLSLSKFKQLLKI